MKATLINHKQVENGHTFGASGMLSLELAVLMMQHNTFIGIPLRKHKTFKADKKSISKCSRFRRYSKYFADLVLLN
jgi:hypothetical protein